MIGDVVGYTTARLLLPALSFGKLRVQTLRSSEGGFNWFGFRHETDGRILVESNMAGWLGLFVWIAALVVVIVFVGG
nr:hypothetical protein [Aurantimonas manganoxydans]